MQHSLTLTRFCNFTTENFVVCYLFYEQITSWLTPLDEKCICRIYLVRINFRKYDLTKKLTKLWWNFFFYTLRLDFIKKFQWTNYNLKSFIFSLSHLLGIDIILVEDFRGIKIKGNKIWNTFAGKTTFEILTLGEFL